MICFHFTTQALHSVPAPSGPLRHIGVLLTPQYAHFLLREGALLNSRSSGPSNSIARLFGGAGAAEGWVIFFLGAAWVPF